MPADLILSSTYTGLSALYGPRAMHIQLDRQRPILHDLDPSLTRPPNCKYLKNMIKIQIYLGFKTVR